MVRLVPMSPEEFDPFLEHLVRGYADDHIRTGRWSAAEGLTEARKEVAGLVPQGLATPNQFFYSIVAGMPEQHVGAVWFAVEPRGGFVYDLLVDEPFRRRGYAEAAMRELETVARAKGVGKLLLHVFGDNEGARRLYRRLGYVETNVLMAKPLASSGDAPPPA